MAELAETQGQVKDQHTKCQTQQQVDARQHDIQADGQQYATAHQQQPGQETMLTVTGIKNVFNPVGQSG